VLAARYAVSERTVDSWMRRFLPHVKLGGVVRFDPQVCDEALKKFMRNGKWCRRDIPLSAANVAEEAASEENEGGRP
jgi:hypothetical protein